MDLSAALHHFHNHHHQEMGSHSDSQSLDTMIACSKPTQAGQEQQQLDKKPRPPDSEAQKCPRCDSANTKFCYYNNYSLTQPRYFCKSCRRYWTKGGTLRNVPVGGGCRRNNKRSSSISSPSFSGNSSFIKRAHSQDIVGPAAPAPNPLFSHFGGGGLGLGLGFGFDHHHHANVTDFDGFLGHPHGGGSFLINNSLHHHHQNHDQNLSYGFGTGNEEVAGGGGGAMAPLEAVTVTAMKQDGCTDNNSKGIWGYHHQPWQMINNGDYHGNMGFGVLPNTDLEPIKETWNGLIGNSISNWQAGLLNAPALI